MNETNTKTGTIVGYFDNQSDAQNAVDALRDAGFTSAHVGMAHRYNDDSYSSKGQSTGTKVKEESEGVWDKVKNFFEGGDVEPYADERRDGDLASREVTPGGNYNSQDFNRSLSGMNVPEQHSRYFGDRLQNSDNGAVVTVNAGDRNDQARAILLDNGADLGDNAANYKYSDTDQNNVTGQKKIQLLGEVLRVHKDRVQTGEVTFRKEVKTDTQTIQVPVQREELVIERHAVSGDRQATGTIGEGDTIRIPLSEERASVDKNTFVREEVSVGKRTVEDVKDLSGEVRSEELIVDDKTNAVRNDR